MSLRVGCAISTQISNATQRSSVEQRLLVRSFERALATLDTQEFTGKMVAIDFYGLTPTRSYEEILHSLATRTITAAKRVRVSTFPLRPDRCTCIPIEDLVIGHQFTASVNN